MPPKNSPPEILIKALLEQPDLKVLDSDDAEEVKDRVALSFKPHELELKRSATAHRSRLHQFSLADISLHRLQYGGEVRVDPGRLEDFFLVQMPITGNAEIACDSEVIFSDTRQGVILSPTQQLSMRYYDNCDQLMLRIERARLEQLCSRYLGHPLKQPLTFKTGFDWLEIPAWRCALEYITRVQLESPVSLQQRLILTQLEELLMAALLSSQAHNYSEHLADHQPRPAPRHVKRIEDYIEAHADEALTPSGLAEIAGVSVRTLYYGFQEFRNTGPMEYLRSVRLRRVREELMSPRPGVSITDIANRWGFTHMSRFSQAYRQLFGELPSETLRKARS